MARLTFFSGTRNASSWAFRAWLALRSAGLDFDEVEVDIRRPQRLLNLAAVGRISPPAMVPVLVDGTRTIFDSLAIMEYANDQAGGELFPEDPLDRAEARSLVAWQHSGLSAICARISFESAFYPFKRPLTAQEVSELPRLFDWLEALLSRSGGPFLFGAAGLADLALTPTAIRLARHDPDLSRWPRSIAWIEEVLAYPLVKEWMDDADRLPHIWFDEYLPEDQPADLHPCRHAAAGEIWTQSDKISRAASPGPGTSGS